eukprot:gene11974-12064_t
MSGITSLRIQGVRSAPGIGSVERVFHRPREARLVTPRSIWHGQDFAALHKGYRRHAEDPTASFAERDELSLYLTTLDDAWFVIDNGIDGMVLDHNGWIINETAMFRHPDLSAPGRDLIAEMGPPIELDDVFVGNDAAWHNYFHFLYWGLARCYLAAKILPKACSIVMPDYVSRTEYSRIAYSQATYDQAFELSGLADRVLKLPVGLYHARHVRFFWTDPPEPTDSLEVPGFREMFAKIREGLVRDSEAPRRILLSRDASAEPRIGAEARDLVRSMCFARGFTVVKFEEMDLRAQANAVFSADCIVAPHGAGLGNVSFGDRNLRVLELNSELDNDGSTRACFFQIATEAGQTYLTLNASRGEITAANLASALDFCCENSPLQALDEHPAEVHVGRDGWLFLQGGSNRVLRLFTDPAAYPDTLAASWRQLLQHRAQRLEAHNIAYRHVVAPDKLSVFPEFYRSILPLFDRTPLRRLVDPDQPEGRLPFLIDPTMALSSCNGALNTYFKTDSHWTIWGAYQVYRMVCGSLGVADPIDFASRQLGRFPVCFDLGLKLDPPVYEDHMFWPPAETITRSFANALVVLRDQADAKGGPTPGHHGTHIILRNSSPHVARKCLVIFGDSFSDYRPSSLTYLFAEAFHEVHFVWSTDIDVDYARRVGADAVVSEIAERFMTRLPTDKLSVMRNTSELMDAFELQAAKARLGTQTASPSPV